MQQLNDKILEHLKVKWLQSVRHMEHNGVMYAVYITNRFRKIGWLAEINGKYYGTPAKMSLKQKDDIIDYYLTIDRNAKETIDLILKQNV